MHCELEKHRKMEALRQEHAQQLKYERCQWERERERANGWLNQGLSQKKCSTKLEFKALSQSWPLQNRDIHLKESWSIPVKRAALICIYTPKVYPDPN